MPIQRVVAKFVHHVDAMLLASIRPWASVLRWLCPACLPVLIIVFSTMAAHAQSVTVYANRATFNGALPANSATVVEDFSSVATNYTMSPTGDQWNGFRASRVGTGTYGDSGYCPLLDSAPITPSYCPNYNPTSPALPGMIGSYDTGVSVIIEPTEEIYAFGFDVVDWNDPNLRSFFTIFFSNGSTVDINDAPPNPDAGFRGYIMDTVSINAGIHIDRIEWTATPGESEIVAYWDFTTVSPEKDFTDGPVTGYGGAEHEIATGLFLGLGVTAETADYDDVAATADTDDGVSLPTLVQAETASIPVTVAGSGGYLQAWIDFDGNGLYSGAGEQIATDVQDGGAGDADSVANGTIVLSTTVPLTATTSQTYARFRWSTSTGLGSSGAADDGEVEDYALTIDAGTPALSVTKVASAPGFITGNIVEAPAGTIVTYTFTITNIGNQTLDNISIADSHNGTGTAPVPDIDTAVLTDNGVIGNSTNTNVANGVWDRLGPLDVLTVTANYTITQTDVDTLR